MAQGPLSGKPLYEYMGASAGVAVLDADMVRGSLFFTQITINNIISLIN